MKKLILCVIFVLCILATDTSASLTLGLQNDAPLGAEVINAYDGGIAVGRSYWYKVEGNYDEYCQTFIPAADFTAQTAYFRLSNLDWTGIGAYLGPIQNADGQTFTMSIHTFTDLTDLTPDSTVATFTGTIPAGWSGTTSGVGSALPLQWMSFGLDTPVALTAGQAYGIEWNWDNTAAANDNTNHRISFSRDQNAGVGKINNSYANGNLLLHNENDVYSDTAGWDREFALSSVPEPATLFVLGLGAMLIRKK